MWPFHASPKRLAERGDVDGLLKILAEELSERQQRRSMKVYVSGTDDPFADGKASSQRKAEAARYLGSVLANLCANGTDLASTGVAEKLDAMAGKIAAENDEYAAKLLGIALYPVKAAPARAILSKMLSSDVGPQLWIDLCRTQDPDVLHHLLPAIPHIAKRDHDMLNPLLEWLEYPVKGAKKTEHYPVEFLLPLILDKKLDYGKQSEACELVVPLLRGATTEHRVLKAILADPVDEDAIKAQGKDAVQVLRKYQKATETDLSERASEQLERLKAPESAESKVLSLLGESPIDYEAIRTLGTEAGKALLSQINSKTYGHIAARLLAEMAYEPAVKAVLRYYAGRIRDAHTSFVIDVGAQHTSCEEFDRAAREFGRCALAALNDVARNRVEAVREAATRAIAAIEGAGPGAS